MTGVQTCALPIWHGAGVTDAGNSDRIERHTLAVLVVNEPGVLEIENRVPEAVRTALTARGHKLKVIGPYAMSTGVVAVGVDPLHGTLRGGADVRRERYIFGW